MKEASAVDGWENGLRGLSYAIGFICAKVNRVKDQAREFFQDSGVGPLESEEAIVAGAKASRQATNAEWEEEIARIERQREKQLDALYAHLGRFLYENIAKENIYYCFDSKNADYEAEAGALLQKIKYALEEEQAVGVSASA